MTKMRTAILVVLTLPLLWLGMRCALNATGMCLDNYHYLSDDVIVDAARMWTYRYHRSSLRDDEVNYDSYDDFVHQNPNCCALIQAARENVAPTFLDRIFGVGRAVVRVVYKANRSPKGSEPELSTTYYFITNCGRAWNGV